jgi:hypothetical protein
MARAQAPKAFELLLFLLRKPATTMVRQSSSWWRFRFAYEPVRTENSAC